MSEKLVIIPRKVTGIGKLVNTWLLVMACLLVLLSAMLSPYVYSVPAMIVISLWVWRRFRCNVEYEYTYYDGDLHIAKITNKARRKNLVNVNMEDVTVIAPRGDRSIYKYENDKSYKRKDYTSGEKGAKVYHLVGKTEKGLCCYAFEPDEDMLNAIMVKYPRSVIK